MSDGPSQGEEMSRGLPTGGTPGCAGGTCAEPECSVCHVPVSLGEREPTEPLLCDPCAQDEVARFRAAAVAAEVDRDAWKRTAEIRASLLDGDDKPFREQIAATEKEAKDAKARTEVLEADCKTLRVALQEARAEACRAAVSSDAERGRLLEANQRAGEILIRAMLPGAKTQATIDRTAVASAAGLLAAARLSTQPLPVTAAEVPGERLGWKRALEKIHDLVGEFGSIPAECLAIIGDYIGEALHWISQGKVPEPHSYPPGACPLCKNSNTVAWHSEPIGEVPAPASSAAHDLRLAIRFLLSCIASGEKLSEKEEAEMRRLGAGPSSPTREAPEPGGTLAELARKYFEVTDCRCQPCGYHFDRASRIRAHLVPLAPEQPRAAPVNPSPTVPEAPTQWADGPFEEAAPTEEPALTKLLDLVEAIRDGKLHWSHFDRADYEPPAPLEGLKDSERAAPPRRTVLMVCPSCRDDHHDTCTDGMLYEDQRLTCACREAGHPACAAPSASAVPATQMGERKARCNGCGELIGGCPPGCPGPHSVDDAGPTVFWVDRVAGGEMVIIRAETRNFGLLRWALPLHAAEPFANALASAVGHRDRAAPAAPPALPVDPAADERIEQLRAAQPPETTRAAVPALPSGARQQETEQQIKDLRAADAASPSVSAEREVALAIWRAPGWEAKEAVVREYGSAAYARGLADAATEAERRFCPELAERIRALSGSAATAAHPPSVSAEERAQLVLAETLCTRDDVAAAIRSAEAAAYARGLADAARLCGMDSSPSGPRLADAIRALAGAPPPPPDARVKELERALRWAISWFKGDGEHPRAAELEHALSGSVASAPPSPAEEPVRLPAIITYRENDTGTISINVPGFTTVRACRHCGVLIAGGPSACNPCANDPRNAEKPAEKPDPVVVAALRSQVMIGEAPDGWHVVTATHVGSDDPASMDTACGKKMLPATQFEQTDAARGHTFCIACLNAWPEPRSVTTAAQPEAT